MDLQFIFGNPVAKKKKTTKMVEKDEAMKKRRARSLAAGKTSIGKKASAKSKSKRKKSSKKRRNPEETRPLSFPSTPQHPSLPGREERKKPVAKKKKRSKKAKKHAKKRTKKRVKKASHKKAAPKKHKKRRKHARKHAKKAAAAPVMQAAVAANPSKKRRRKRKSAKKHSKKRRKHAKKSHPKKRRKAHSQVPKKRRRKRKQARAHAQKHNAAHSVMKKVQAKKRSKKRKHRSKMRNNPFGGNSIMAKQIPYGVNHTVAEVGALALGGALIEGISAAVEKMLPSVKAMTDKIPGGEVILPLLAGIGLGNVKNGHAQMIGKGLVAASVVTLGTDIATKVTGRVPLATPTLGDVTRFAAMRGLGIVDVSREGKADYDLAGVTGYHRTRADFGYRPDQLNYAADFNGRIEQMGNIPKASQIAGLPRQSTGLGDEDTRRALHAVNPDEGVDENNFDDYG